jgi:O-antigen ligase
MLSAQSMSAKTDQLGLAVARAIGRPVRPTRPRPWTRLIWTYLLGATMLTTLIDLDPDMATAAAAAGGCVILLFGWLVRVESLFLLLILVLPFDGLKFAGVLGLSNALMVVIALKSVLEMASGRRRLYRSWIYLPMSLFTVAVVVSSINAADPAFSLRLGLTVFSGMAITVAALNLLKDVASLDRAVFAVILAAVYVAVVGLAQIVMWRLAGWEVLNLRFFDLMNLGLTVPHLASVFESEAILGIYLICGTVCALTFAFGPRKVGRGRRFRASAIVLLLASLLTFSRALIVTYMVGLPLVLFAAKRRLGRRLRPWMIVVAAPFLLAAGWKTIQLVNEWNPGSTLTRLSLFRGGLATVMEHPLFGNGLGVPIYPQSWGLARTLSGAGRDLTSEDYVPRDLHNTYLSLLVNTGGVGFVSFCWILVAVWREGRRRPRTIADPRQVMFRRGLLGAFALTLMSIGFNGVVGVKAIWLVFGLAAAVGRLADARPRRLAGAGAVRA